MESVLAGVHERSWADRHAAGCFLFMIYARARFSDMMNVSSITLEAHELDGERFGYIEAEVTRSKTSYSLDRRVRLLPMSATIQGISNFFWAAERLVSRLHRASLVFLTELQTVGALCLFQLRRELTGFVHCFC